MHIAIPRATLWRLMSNVGPHVELEQRYLLMVESNMEFEMYIKMFRIMNYRSIVDSGDCFLSGDNVTIFAGKNESGKTSVLEALEDFSVGKPIRKEAIHIHRQDLKPEISVTFEISEYVIHDFIIFLFL